MPHTKAYINHTQVVCCAGETSEALFHNICTQTSGISCVEKHPDSNVVALGKIHTPYALDTLLHLTCKAVLEESNLTDFSDTVLLVGSSVGGMQHSEMLFFQDHHYKRITPALHTIDAIAHHLKQFFTFKDVFSFSTACTSSANALGFAFEVLQKGIFRNVLVVGFDTLSQTTIHGFDALGVLSSSPCKPFDKHRDGMNVAEGLGVLLLQNTPHEHSVELVGVGYSSDAHHMTQPSPEGLGALTAMRQALGALDPTAVDYINAHGTGTLANDASEAAAISSLFGSRPFVSSTKSITGHTLGAAGAIEAIICAQALLQGRVPPNTNLQDPDTQTLTLPTKALDTPLRYALSNSLAFGGNNTSLLFGRL
ncbi:MAG: beta-ketoacyl-[acyl-carrier-protein] synthase family protein [Campylobacterales bacterium]|nr:beta-ketoacyl-[acyl-carrier-protein] synthase family protein [Campylobacterales bacterium]